MPGESGNIIARRTRERWENNAPYWTTIIRQGRDRYRTELTDAAVLDAVGACEGLRILDAGCGEGYLSRRIAHGGAHVVGLDTCQGLIKAAESVATPPRGSVSYVRASADAVPAPDDTFDLVFCNHLFSHLPDSASVISEFGRILKSGGRLVILTLHPCFYVGNSERGAMNSVPASQYFALRGIEQRFKVDGLTSPSVITSWLRPLECYVDELRSAGFVIVDLREPHPSREQLENDPWWRESFPTALFMLLVAQRR